MLGGRSVGSTMGFTALDGLPMGTRCGQLDPGVLLYLMDQEGMSAAEITDLLYRRSGLLGLSGLSNDIRTLEAAGTPEAEQANDYFVFRVRREHSQTVRYRVCEGLQWLGIEIDRSRNAEDAYLISTELSRAHVLVMPTNEETVITRAADDLIAASAGDAPG